MYSRARYLLILVFFLVVIGGMFFIYSTIDSPEREVFYNDEPRWYERSWCLVSGGRIDVHHSPGVELDGHDYPNKIIYSCHYH